jgi:hypothetical protein
MNRLTASLALMWLGGVIYVATRTQSLLMFQWFNAVGLQDDVQEFRLWGGPLFASLPRWISLSLPQALWYASGLLMFQFIWRANETWGWQRRLWMLTFSAGAVGLEVGQLCRIVPGRLDVLDLALLLMSGGAVAVYSSFEKPKSSRVAEETANE